MASNHPHHVEPVGDMEHAMRALVQPFRDIANHVAPDQRRIDSVHGSSCSCRQCNPCPWDVTAGGLRSGS